MNMNVLIVDVSEAVRKNIVTLLSEIGPFEITETDNSEKAIKWFKQQPYHLVLSDWNMQTEEGNYLVQELRNLNQETPILLTTTQQDQKQAIDINNGSTTDMLIKPFTTDSLRETLDKYLAAQSG